MTKRKIKQLEKLHGRFLGIRAANSAAPIYDFMNKEIYSYELNQETA